MTGYSFVATIENDELKFNITRRVKLATISWGWTYSEGNREKRGIRVHEECQAGTQWSWKAQSGGTERSEGGPGSRTRARIEGRGEAKHIGLRAI